MFLIIGQRQVWIYGPAVVLALNVYGRYSSQTGKCEEARSTPAISVSYYRYSLIDLLQDLSLLRANLRTVAPKDRLAATFLALRKRVIIAMVMVYATRCMVDGAG